MLKKVFYGILILVCLTGILSLGACNSKEKKKENSKEYILRCSRIEIPNDSIFLYGFTDNTFVNGRHASFTVFEFANEPTDWLKENKFLNSNDETSENCKTTLVKQNERYVCGNLGDGVISIINSNDETTEYGKKALVQQNERYFWDYFGDGIISTTIDNIKIPKKYIPNFEILYLWNRKQNVYFFYYPDSLTLIVYIAWS